MFSRYKTYENRDRRNAISLPRVFVIGLLIGGAATQLENSNIYPTQAGESEELQNTSATTETTTEQPSTATLIPTTLSPTLRPTETITPSSTATLTDIIPPEVVGEIERIADSTVQVTEETTPTETPLPTSTPVIAEYPLNKTIHIADSTKPMEFLPNVIRPVHDLRSLDSNQDGIIEDGEVYPGEIVFRPDDGETQIEEGQYLVPDNRVFVDSDGDGILDQTPVHARLVVVTRDNLTYLFAENSNQVIGVFPNGTGRGGANTVASIRTVDAFLGEQWGIDESERLGFDRNAYGIITIATSYYIDDATKVNTAQEVHGTPDEWKHLLGTEISGGCTRHRNRDIATIRRHINYDDFVVTMDTPEDDTLDNPYNLYNLTRLAAGLSPVSVPEAIEYPLLLPSNYDPLSTLPPLETSRWVSFPQIGRIPLPETISHPYTRAEYNIIPCGAENMFLIELLAGNERLIPTENGYRLHVSPFITLPNGESLSIKEFYTPTEVTHDQINTQLYRFSTGEHIPYFQYLVADYAFQYAVYVAARDWEEPSLLTSDRTTQGEAMLHLSNEQLREVQLVTGLIPVKYSWTQGILPQEPGDFLRGLENRTLIHSLMNIFYGQPGQSFELDFRAEPFGLAYPLQDQFLIMPSPDHELIRHPNTEGLDISTLISGALSNNQGIILRVSQFAAHTTPLRYELGLSRAHYYSLIPEQSNLEEGYVAIYDTMHPSEILQVRIEYLDDIFTTITLTPQSSIQITSKK